jgi:hypothetical protein
VRASSEGPSTAAIRQIGAACARRGQEALDAKDRGQALAWCLRTLALGRALARLLVPARDGEDEEEGVDYGYRLEQHLPGEEFCARVMAAFGPSVGHPVLGADRAARRFLRAQARCWGSFAEARRVYLAFAEHGARDHVCDCERGVLERVDALGRWVEILRGFVHQGWLRADPALRSWLSLPPLPRVPPETAR